MSQEQNAADLGPSAIDDQNSAQSIDFPQLR
jgi:hypothetical protein